MASTIIQEINTCASQYFSFRLKGGAGSGKTYTLLQFIDTLYKKNINVKICCVTYTNAAVEEIKNRCPYKYLSVNTIHDTLWNFISVYMKSLVKEYKIHILNKYQSILSDEEKSKINNLSRVFYRDYLDLKEGVIDHENMIELSCIMFNKYKLLVKIFSEKYDYILIDEYQDTLSEFLEICELCKSYNKNLVVGLFGDIMQSIYDENYKNKELSLDDYIKVNSYKDIIKEDNYRCSKKVIELLNKIRTDKLEQKPVNNNYEGSITFLYSHNDINLSSIKSNPIFSMWDFNNYKKTKELYLSYSLIAKELNFDNYLSAFQPFGQNKSARAIGKKEEDRLPLVNYIFKVIDIVQLYKDNKISKVLPKISTKIKTYQDKNIIKKLLDNLVDKINEKNSIMDIVEFANENHILNLKNELITDDEKTLQVFDNLSKVDFNEIINAKFCAEEKSPFSTQHNIKGQEFENVFVLLDNNKWYKYNFKSLFENNKTNLNVYNRTKNLFYVCCSRAKNNLVLFFPQPSNTVIETAKNWFGDKNVIEI